MTYFQRRIDQLAHRLKARTKADGTARPGFEQNVAALRAEIEQLTEREGYANAE
jgi:hypothetical protein